MKVSPLAPLPNPLIPTTTPAASVKYACVAVPLTPVEAVCVLINVLATAVLVPVKSYIKKVLLPAEVEKLPVNMIR